MGPWTDRVRSRGRRPRILWSCTWRRTERRGDIHFVADLLESRHRTPSYSSRTIRSMRLHPHDEAEREEAALGGLQNAWSRTGVASE
jgi:hypothetical protein